MILTVFVKIYFTSKQLSLSLSKNAKNVIAASWYTYTYTSHTHIHIRVNEELYCGDESCPRLPFLFSLNSICCKILLLLPYDTYSRRSIKRRRRRRRTSLSLFHTRKRLLAK